MSSRLLGGLLLSSAAACGAGVQAEPPGAPATSLTPVKSSTHLTPSSSASPTPPEEPALARLRALDVFEVGPASAPDGGEPAASARRERFATAAEKAARGAAPSCATDPTGERATLDPAVVKTVERDLDALRALKIVDARGLIEMNEAQQGGCYAGKEAQRPCVERVTRVCERAGKLHAIVRATTEKAP